MPSVRAFGSERTASALLLALAASPALAVDTLETWEKGAADVEAYVSMDGLGRRRADQSLASDLLVGYGVTDRLATYLSMTMQGNGYLAEGAPAVRLGLFGTVLDRRHLDLDLMFEVGGDGPGLSQLQVSPGLELNFDFDTPAGPAGLYARAAIAFQGRSRADGYATDAAPEIVPGLHWRFHPRHQLLVEASFAGESLSLGTGLSHGGVALGWNVALTETLELVAQASLGPAQPGALAGGFMLGFIATLPGGAPVPAVAEAPPPEAPEAGSAPAERQATGAGDARASLAGAEPAR